MLHLAVHLVDEAVALLRACVEESEVVLVGLNLLLELLEAASQASALVVESLFATLCHILDVSLEVVQTAALCRDVQLLVDAVEHFVISLVELVLLLVGHVSHLVVFLCERLHLLLRCLSSILCERLQLLDDALLLLEVGVLLVALSCAGCVASLEELVACAEELLPELVADLLRNHAYGLPFLLQRDELVACSLPVGAVGKRLRLLYERLLLLDVLRECDLERLEVFGLASEEVVAGSAEALEYLHVHLLRSEADSLPLVLNVDNLLRALLPVGSALVLSLAELLYLLAESGLASQILLLLSAKVLEVLLVALVDYGRRSLEACPYLLAQFLCDRTYLAILLVQLLQLVERADDVLLVGELLCSLAELGLHLEVLLEVVFASLRVELEQVVELLYI